MSPPDRLWIVRHGESAGNVALSLAESQGHHLIDVSPRDADVPLSPLGERQARALGAWFARMPQDAQPTVVLSSPYRRALDTMNLLVNAAGFVGVPTIVDERLREKEFGVLNRMTKAGILAQLPEQAALREVLGKFYYRPPGGESWCDLVLRLRSVWATLCAEHDGERVLLVCHSAVTLCLRYVVEQLDERRLLEIDRATDVANCSVTSYAPAADRRGRRTLALETFNFCAPLEEAGTPVTASPDAPLPK